MSYCRFSSDDWSCDIYAYADVSGGYTVHVAANRYVGVPKIDPLPQDFTDEQFDKWFKGNQMQLDFLETAEQVRIGLPDDGKTYNYPDLRDFLNALLAFQQIGYHVPQDVIDAVEEEWFASDDIPF